TDVFEARLTRRGRKRYYRFHGSELGTSSRSRDVLRNVLMEDGNWTVIQYVPVPSSMHAMCLAAILDEHGTSPLEFDVRVHKHFELTGVETLMDPDPDAYDPSAETVARLERELMGEALSTVTIVPTGDTEEHVHAGGVGCRCPNPNPDEEPF
ncbi:MAG: hypothetical protein ACYS30_22750, partial [Planctomycetota bacterium]